MKFGRTSPKKKGFFESLKSFDLKQLKEIRWKDLPPEQKRKVMLGAAAFFILLIVMGALTQNDEDMYKSTISDFIHESAVYNVNGVGKTTTSAAHQLVVSQTQKLSNTKARNYKTQVDDIKTEIVSQNGNSMIATARVDGTNRSGKATQLLALVHIPRAEGRSKLEDIEPSGSRSEDFQ